VPRQEIKELVHQMTNKSITSDIARVLFFTTWILSAAAPSLGQHEDHEAMERVPPEILERPVQLRRGIGTAHEKVTTSSPQAQAFYDQGLAYLHSFVWIEAARSFNQALRLDPNLAMAYLGLSDAQIGLQDVSAARLAFDKAQALADKVSERERVRIAIRSRQIEYLEDSGNLQKYFPYRQAISDAIKDDPHNPWLWILRGFADEGIPLAHGQGGSVDTIAFYEIALGFTPDNFAAHHYLAHTFENLGLTKDALEQSEAYAQLAPAIPHAHHMLGHELRRVGRSEEAVREFRQASELEQAYYISENIPARYDWHHAHNLNLLAMSYHSLGQLKAAEAAYREAFSLPAYTDLAEFNRKSWPEFLLNRGRPEEALDAAQELIKSAWPLGRFAGHTVAGRALLALDRTDEATSELSMAGRESERIPPAVMEKMPDAAALYAEILVRKKNWEQSNPLMEQIQEKMEATPGPDAWCEVLFEFESFARIARESGDWELAESTAHRMIQHDPSYAGGHYALGLVAEHKGEANTAREEFAIGDKLWSTADANVQRPSVPDP